MILSLQRSRDFLDMGERLADFVAALDEASDRDVTTWVEQWLRTTGYDTLRVEREGELVATADDLPAGLLVLLPADER